QEVVLHEIRVLQYNLDEAASLYGKLGFSELHFAYYHTNSDNFIRYDCLSFFFRFKVHQYHFGIFQLTFKSKVLWVIAYLFCYWRSVVTASVIRAVVAEFQETIWILSKQTSSRTLCYLFAVDIESHYT